VACSPLVPFFYAQNFYLFFEGERFPPTRWKRNTNTALFDSAVAVRRFFVERAVVAAAPASETCGERRACLLCCCPSLDILLLFIVEPFVVMAGVFFCSLCLMIYETKFSFGLRNFAFPPSRRSRGRRFIVRSGRGGKDKTLDCLDACKTSARAN
jgi:hypothetical protein